MQDKLNEIEKAALASLAEVNDPAAVEAWRVTHLGRSSELMGVFSGLGKLSKEDTSYDNVLDAFRLALKGIKLVKKERLIE